MVTLSMSFLSFAILSVTLISISSLDTFYNVREQKDVPVSCLFYCIIIVSGIKQNIQKQRKKK